MGECPVFLSRLNQMQSDRETGTICADGYCLLNLWLQYMRLFCERVHLRVRVVQLLLERLGRTLWSRGCLDCLVRVLCFLLHHLVQILKNTLMTMMVMVFVQFVSFETSVCVESV